jgi:hypothetical protein
MAIVDQQAKRAPIYQQALISAPSNVVRDWVVPINVDKTQNPLQERACPRHRW